MVWFTQNESKTLESWNEESNGKERTNDIWYKGLVEVISCLVVKNKFIVYAIKYNV